MIDIEDVKQLTFDLWLIQGMQYRLQAENQLLRARIAELEASITELMPESAPDAPETDAEGETGIGEPTYTSATA